MPRFRHLSDLDLQDMEDDAIVAYVVAARDAREHAAAVRALRILVYGHLGTVRRRVAIKVPRHAVDEVAEVAMMSALTSSFDGTSVGEFRSWLNTITDRRVADHHRRSQLDTVPLGGEHEGEEDVWGETPVAPDATSAVETQVLVAGILDGLRPDHRHAIDLFVFEQHSAREVAEQVNVRYRELDPPMREDNVHKIAQRFRDDLRRELGAGPGDTS